MGIQPENERKGKGERERGSWHSGRQISKKPVQEAGLRDWSILSRSGKLFILLVVHRDQWVIQNYAASAALTLIETRLLLCIPSCIHKSYVISIIFWPEGQFTFYGPFLIRVSHPENLFALKSVVLPKVWCHSQKALNKVTFLHSKDTTIYNKERGVEWFITKRKLINSKL